MLWSFTLYLLCVALGVSAQNNKNSKYVKVYKLMRRAKIVPDIIPIAPTNMLYVSFLSGLKATLGNELTPTHVKHQPWVKWDDASPSSYYTICMVDPDAPARLKPTEKEWQHWLVVNIPGIDISEGETLSEYIGAKPSPISGFHRYVFLVYRQPQKIKFDEPRLTKRMADKREKFSIAKFAVKYKLNNPIAGNFFIAQFDSHVPKIYKELEKDMM